MNEIKEWYAFDFDDTLRDTKTDKPIQENIDLLKQYIEKGKNVYILTGSLEQYLYINYGAWFTTKEHEEARESIRQWLYNHGITIGYRDITCIKKHNTVEIIDNACRCVK